MDFVRMGRVHVVDDTRHGPPSALADVISTREETIAWDLAMLPYWTICGEYAPTATGRAETVSEFPDSDLCGRCIATVNRRAEAGDPDLIGELFSPDRSPEGAPP